MLNQEQLHCKVLYPVVRVRTQKAGGSGVLVYSQPDPKKPNKYLNVALSCEHVIHDSVTVKEDWDPVLKQERKKDFLEEVQVEVFDYDGSRIVSANSTQADIIAYDAHHDMAALKLHNSRQMPFVAGVVQEADIDSLRLFDPVFAAGASLLHEPFATDGRITFLREIIDQKEYLMTSASSVFGACLPGDALVSLADGRVRQIKDIKQSDMVWAIQPYGGLHKHPVTDVIPAGKKTIRKIKTRTRTIRCSDDHPLLMLKSARSWTNEAVNWLEWTPAREAAEGSVIAILPGVEQNERGYGIRFTDHIGQHKDIETQRERVRMFVELMGFFLGDGWVRARQGISYDFNLATYDQEDAEHFKKSIIELFGETNFAPTPNVVTCYRKDMVQVIQAVGLDYPSTEKTVPDWVMAQPRELQLSFLEGYLKADGHINKLGDWVFEASSFDLIRKLRMMAIHLGFNVSNLHSRMREPHALKDGREIKPTKPSTAFTVYPNYSESRNSALKGDVSSLPSFLYYETVSENTSDGEEETYDIKVQGAYNFFADGVAVHNSGGALMHADTGLLLGLICRVTAIQLGFGVDVLAWMNFVSHPKRLYEFFKDQELQFLYDPADDYYKAMERRERRRKDALRSILLGAENGNQNGKGE